GPLGSLFYQHTDVPSPARESRMRFRHVALYQQSHGRTFAAGTAEIGRGVLGCIKKTTTRIIPKGTSARSCHQPLRFVSWSRLAPTAIIGNRVKSENKT